MSDSEVWRQYEEQESAKGKGKDHGHGHGHHGGNVPEPAAYGFALIGMCVVMVLWMRLRGNARKKRM